MSLGASRRTPPHPAWFIVGDAACLLDPLSSKGVLRAMMSGIAAGHLIANVLHGRIAADAAANVYQHWLSEWFAREASVSRHSIGSSGLPIHLTRSFAPD